MFRSIRGATTVESNNKTEILEATKELLNQIITDNSLDISQIISIIFTCTKDLDQVYPAVVAREMGITDAALMCVSELHIEGSLPMCIRLMVSVQTDVPQSDVRHVYLRNAKSLRPDIVRAAADGIKYFQIAIDGPSGVGKSTAAKLCAKELGFSYIDTGAMYRAFAYYCMKFDIDVTDERQVDEIVDKMPMEVKFISGVQTIYLAGKIVAMEELRTQAVVYSASKISQIAAVRKKLVSMQRELAGMTNVVMDGRDVGTVVLKDSPLKIYLDASAKIRAKRRVSELERLGHSPDYDIILKEVLDRDYRDMNRLEAPLKKADDAVEIICDNMDADEVCAVICALARKRMLGSIKKI